MSDSASDDPTVDKTQAAVSKLEETLAEPNGKIDRTRVVDLIEQIKEHGWTPPELEAAVRGGKTNRRPGGGRRHACHGRRHRAVDG